MEELFIEWLNRAVKMGGSDIHLTVGLPPSVRVDGNLGPLEGEETILTNEMITIMADSMMKERQKTTLEEAGEADFAYSVAGLGRFRVNVFKQRGSTAMVLRILNLTIPSPDVLGMPNSIVQMTKKKRGLVLVTGITGSGKSTTLACLIDIINSNYPHHIITLEDPIEYLHRHKKSVVNQREMGMDSENYASALRAALRQDPDVILVGEMRDLETISTAITAAETGHLVFSTLHTLGAASTVDRIIDVFPPFQQQQVRTQLAEALECVVSQQLLPKAGGKGRSAAFEVMLANGAIKNMIREAKTYQIPTVLQTSRKAGMQTMDDAIYDLIMKGSVEREDGVKYATDPKALMKRLGM